MNHALLLQDAVVRNGTSLVGKKGFVVLHCVSAVLELGVPGLGDCVNWHSP